MISGSILPRDAGAAEPVDVPSPDATRIIAGVSPR